jgi:hypothetical protein
MTIQKSERLEVRRNAKATGDLMSIVAMKAAMETNNAGASIYTLTHICAAVLEPMAWHLSAKSGDVNAVRELEAEGGKSTHVTRDMLLYAALFVAFCEDKTDEGKAMMTNSKTGCLYGQEQLAAAAFEKLRGYTYDSLFELEERHNAKRRAAR